MPAAVNRHLLKTGGLAAGVHISTSATDPEVVQIQLFEPPGIQATPGAREGDREALLPAGVPPSLLRRARGDVASLRVPPRATSTICSQRSTSRASGAARFRIVVDYSYSSASLILPLVLGALEVETIGSHALRHGPARPTASVAALQESFGQAKRLVSAAGADFGVVLDQAAERLYLVDEEAREVPMEQELLLLRLA